MEKVDLVANPWEVYEQMKMYFNCIRLQQGCLYPKDALIAPESEVVANSFERAQKRRRLSLEVFGAHDCNQLLLLTDVQRTYLQVYSWKWWSTHGQPPGNDPNAFFNLTDNPAMRGGGGSTASMRFPTFRRNTSNLWSACKRRFLTPNEQATCMGYAVYPETALASSSHQDSFYGFSAQPLLGNAMHKANIGCITAIALSCCRLKSSHDGSIADHHGSIADL